MKLVAISFRFNIFVTCANYIIYGVLNKLVATWWFLELDYLRFEVCEIFLI
jgi:hypothetical protein